MSYLALSKKHLSRISYHSIWGIQIDVSGRKSLYEEVTALHAQPDRLQLITNENNATSERIWFMRGIHWCFNINQYRTNYYLLQGYYSWQLYEQGLLQLTGSTKSETDDVGGFILAKDSELVKKFDENLLNKIDLSANSVWFYKKISTWFGKSLVAIGDGISRAINVFNPVTHFIATKKMLPYLTILGVNSKENNQISLAYIKDARKKCLLSSHPDHNNGVIKSDLASVQQIKDAFDELLKLINSTCDSSCLLKERSELFQRMDRAQENLNKAKTAYDNYNKKVDHFQADANAFINHANQYGERVDRCAEDVRQFRTGVDQLKTGVGVLNEHCHQAGIQQQQNQDTLSKIKKILASSKADQALASTQNNNVSMFASYGSTSESSDSDAEITTYSQS